MKIADLFSRPIDRRIEEVIKVDDDSSILTEIEEYIATEHIADELVEVLNAYQETINSPNEGTTVWVSGFFGSGKSSFAKVLGYLLANPIIDGKPVAQRFFELNDIPQAQALLNTIHSQAPSEVVLLDLSQSTNVLSEGEPVVLPVYRALLTALGYSRDVTLAELEYALEGRDDLEQFTATFEQVIGRTWEDSRDIILAKSEASRTLHELDPATYPSADSWSSSAAAPEVNENWFANRAVELLARRRKDHKRLVFVVDEVGQYVARSTKRMLHLQGLAQAIQKKRGALWLVATSQEALTDVVDSLEGSQVELARAIDRFPIRVDLLPSDIDEVAGRRVLDKNASGANAVSDALETDHNKLTTSVTLQSDRHEPFSADDFVRLYPLVPYQLQLLIDAVSARRAQGGAPQTMGGSNRTIIKHTQQLIINASVGLAEEEVGSLVTIDRSYTLLEEVIPTAWRHEVDQVAGTHGDDSLQAKIMRVVALCTDVPGLPLNSRNLAVLLHPSTSSDPIETAVREALDTLVNHERLREGEDGYELQSPEQKDWEKTRRSIDLKPGDALRLRKRLLKDALGGLSVSKGRTFKVELTAEGEKVSDGDVRLDVREDDDVDALRTSSRSEDSKTAIFWAYQVSNGTWDALTDLHRSLEMIDRHDNPSQTDAQRTLLTEERRRRDRGQRRSEQLLANDLVAGTFIFDGNTEDIPTGELRTAAERIVSDQLAKIYPDLDMFSATFKKTDVLQILQADTLDGLPTQCGAAGLGLLRMTPTGPELVTDSGPIHSVVSHIEARKRFGEDQNGGQLERHFGGPPYGAPTEAVQAVLAAAMRAGLVEVVSQASRITSATDRRLEQVFGNLPKFRAASFNPATEGAVTIEVRGEVAEWLAKLTGDPVSLDVSEIAHAGRKLFGPLRHPCTEARSTLRGAGLAIPDLLSTMDELLGRAASADDELVVETMHERQADYESGMKAVTDLAELIDTEIETLRSAAKAARARLICDEDLEQAAEQLQELLDRGRYAEDLAQIKALTTQIETAEEAAEQEARSALELAIAEGVERLRESYPTVGVEEFDDAVDPLRALTAGEGLALLQANQQAVAGATSQAADALDRLSTTKQVVQLRVTEVWSAAITSEDDLEAALARLKEAVLAHLEPDTEVRFR